MSLGSSAGSLRSCSGSDTLPLQPCSFLTQNHSCWHIASFQLHCRHFWHRQSWKMFPCICSVFFEVCQWATVAFRTDLNPMHMANNMRTWFFLLPFRSSSKDSHSLVGWASTVSLSFPPTIVTTSSLSLKSNKTSWSCMMERWLVFLLQRNLSSGSSLPQLVRRQFLVRMHRQGVFKFSSFHSASSDSALLLALTEEVLVEAEAGTPETAESKSLSLAMSASVNNLWRSSSRTVPFWT